jgi:hypothetical protein
MVIEKQASKSVTKIRSSRNSRSACQCPKAQTPFAIHSPLVVDIPAACLFSEPRVTGGHQRQSTGYGLVPQHRQMGAQKKISRAKKIWETTLLLRPFVWDGTIQAHTTIDGHGHVK